MRLTLWANGKRKLRIITKDKIRGGNMEFIVNPTSTKEIKKVRDANYREELERLWHLYGIDLCYGESRGMLIEELLLRYDSNYWRQIVLERGEK